MKKAFIEEEIEEGNDDDTIEEQKEDNNDSMFIDSEEALRPMMIYKQLQSKVMTPHT